MTYRILSLERIDAATLPKPMAAGWARWHALVEFWDGEAIGPAPLTAEIVTDRPTMKATAVGGDDWTLAGKEDSLVEIMTELIERHEVNYVAEIRAGVRGFRGDRNPDQHGEVVGGDAIAHSTKVRDLIGKVQKAKEGGLK